jgi:hypothetical protein
VTDRFQDGRRRHVGNSSAIFKMTAAAILEIETIKWAINAHF